MGRKVVKLTDKTVTHAVPLLQRFRNDPETTLVKIYTGEDPDWEQIPEPVREALIIGAEALQAIYEDLVDVTPYDEGWYTGFAISTIVSEVAVYAISAGTGVGNAVTLPAKFAILANRIGPKFGTFGGKFITILNKLDFLVTPRPGGPPDVTPAPSGFIRRGLDLVDCFVAGTPVYTDQGMTPIERVQRGDLVLTRDGADGNFVYRRVTALHTTYHTELYTIGYDPDGNGPATDGKLVTSGPHPFYVPGRGWVEARDLTPGDALILADGTLTHITGVSVAHAEPGEQFTAYNLTIDGLNTFFAGDGGVWVHNVDAPTLRWCEKLFARLEGALKAFPGDPARAYEQTIRKALEAPPNKRPPHPALWNTRVKALELIDQMKLDGKLDEHLARLGDDVSGFKPHEAFAARRFEIERGQIGEFRRPPRMIDADGADVDLGDLLDEGGRRWDIKSAADQPFEDAWPSLKNRIIEHLSDESNVDGVDLLDGEGLLLDLSGYSAVDIERAKDLVRRSNPLGIRVEYLED